MSDTLYLSLWYPNLRLAGLGDKIAAVLSAFAEQGGDARVYSATVWPVSWSETPVFQQVWGRIVQVAGDHPPVEPPGALAAEAVAEALEILHDDFAYEFQIGWSLWELERTDDSGSAAAPVSPPQSGVHAVGKPPRSPNARWTRQPRLVRVVGYGPLFDEGAYEADGHIRIEFGSDAPFLEEDVELDAEGARHVEENIRQLVALTATVEKASGATARLLWSELGESLAERLAARLATRPGARS